MTTTDGIAGGRILSLIERIEHLEEEIKATSATSRNPCSISICAPSRTPSRKWRRNRKTRRPPLALPGERRPPGQGSNSLSQ